MQLNLQVVQLQEIQTPEEGHRILRRVFLATDLPTPLLDATRNIADLARIHLIQPHIDQAAHVGQGLLLDVAVLVVGDSQLAEEQVLRAQSTRLLFYLRVDVDTEEGVRHQSTHVEHGAVLLVVGRDADQHGQQPGAQEQAPEQQQGTHRQEA